MSASTYKKVELQLVCRASLELWTWAKGVHFSGENLSRALAVLSTCAGPSPDVPGCLRHISVSLLD